MRWVVAMGLTLALGSIRYGLVQNGSVVGNGDRSLLCSVAVLVGNSEAV